MKGLNIPRPGRDGKARLCQIMLWPVAGRNEIARTVGVSGNLDRSHQRMLGIERERTFVASRDDGAWIKRRATTVRDTEHLHPALYCSNSLRARAETPEQMLKEHTAARTLQAQEICARCTPVICASAEIIRALGRGYEG